MKYTSMCFERRVLCVYVCLCFRRLLGMGASVIQTHSLTKTAHTLLGDGVT